MANGKIVNTPAQKAIHSSFISFLKFDKLADFDVINFRALSAKLRLADGRAIFDDFAINSDAGDWALKGAVGFDALMNMTVSNKLTKGMSDPIVKTLDAGKSALKNVLQGTAAGAAVAGMVDNVNLVPRDNNGRITLTFGLGGLVSGPKVTGMGFGAGTTQKQQAAPTPQQSIKQQVTQVIQEKKQEVVQQVEQKKAEVQQTIEQEKQRAAEEIRRQEEEAKKKLGGFLKR